MKVLSSELLGKNLNVQFTIMYQIVVTEWKKTDLCFRVLKVANDKRLWMHWSSRISALRQASGGARRWIEWKFPKVVWLGNARNYTKAPCCSQYHPKTREKTLIQIAFDLFIMGINSITAVIWHNHLCYGGQSGDPIVYRPNTSIQPIICWTPFIHRLQRWFE